MQVSYQLYAWAHGLKIHVCGSHPAQDGSLACPSLITLIPKVNDHTYNHIQGLIVIILYYNRLKDIRQQFTDNIKLKFANFDSLSEQDKINFCFQ